MKKLFEIGESEKKRILEMHENATKKNYLSEQGTTQPTQPTQRAAFHNILNVDGSQSSLSTTLSKIQNMGDLSKFNPSVDDPKAMIDKLNATGIKMFYPPAGPDKTITTIPTGIGTNEVQVKYAGSRLRNLLSLLAGFLTFSVCADSKTPCSATFTPAQVLKAFNAMKNAKADMAPELGGRISSYPEGIKTVDTLNKTQKRVGGDLSDGLLKNIDYNQFFIAATKLIQDSYNSL